MDEYEDIQDINGQEIEDYTDTYSEDPIGESETTIDSNPESFGPIYKALTEDFPIIKQRLFRDIQGIITLNNRGMAYIESYYNSNMNMNTTMISHRNPNQADFDIRKLVLAMARTFHGTLIDHHLEFGIPREELDKCLDITILVMVPIFNAYKRSISSVTEPDKPLLGRSTTKTQERFVRIPAQPPESRKRRWI